MRLNQQIKAAAKFCK